jgi:hypothetical protein
MNRKTVFGSVLAVFGLVVMACDTGSAPVGETGTFLIRIADISPDVMHYYHNPPAAGTPGIFVALRSANTSRADPNCATYGTYLAYRSWPPGENESVGANEFTCRLNGGDFEHKYIGTSGYYDIYIEWDNHSHGAILRNRPVGVNRLNTFSYRLFGEKW